MSLKAGLVGLPNVGKSTLFNALTKANAPAENYPFCTINPHNARTPVLDPRLEILKNLYNSQKTIPVLAEFVDIAGLVKGAASGEGLGNQFLSHIKEVSLIIHVLRCFEDSNITHVNNSVNPLRDFDIILMELALKDLETLQNRLAKIGQLLKKSSQPKEKELYLHEEIVIKKVIELINSNQLQSIACLDNIDLLDHLNLLILKNFLIVANIAEDQITNPMSNPWIKKLNDHFGEHKVLPISAKIESEIISLSDEDAEEYKNSLGIKESGLNFIIRKTYQSLNLMTFFTCGPKEIHAWQINVNTNIRKAAGEIHSDLERGFICAHVFNTTELIEHKSEVELRNKGKIRTVGADYIVQDGDIVNIQFNV